MGKKDPPIDEKLYVSVLFDALDMVLPDDPVMRPFCYEIVGAIMLAYFDSWPLRQSDLDALEAAFARAVDAMGG